MTIDLHLHTKASDGNLKPLELIRKAESLNLKVIAITDHDTVDGLREILTTKRTIKVIPALELSCNLDDLSVHILGYFIDLQNKELDEFLITLQKARGERIKKMLGNLKKLGLNFQEQAVNDLLKLKNPGRMHLARLLLASGYANTCDQAFAEYLTKGKPAYVPRFKLTPAEAIARINSFGGISVLAHPRGDFDLSSLKTLKEAGLVGLEVIHPSHTQEQTENLLVWARELELVPTGGSDCHGPDIDGQALLGTMNVPYGWFVTLQNQWQKIKDIRGGRLSK